MYRDRNGLSQLGVLLNPLAGKGRTAVKADAFRPLLGPEGNILVPQNFSELKEGLQHWLSQDIKIIAIHGGDGTVHQALSALRPLALSKAWPAIVYLRGGTQNTVANSLRMFGSPLSRLERLVRVLQKERVPKVHDQATLSIGDRLGFIFGNGIVTDFLNLYYERNVQGYARTAWLAAKSVGNAWLFPSKVKSLARGVRLEMRCDDDVAWSPFFGLGLAVATVQQIGLALAPFDSIHPLHDAFSIWAYKGSLRQLTLDLPRFYLGHNAPNSLRQRAARLFLRSDEPLTYTIDGDLYGGARELEITLGPRLRLIDP